MTEDTFFVLPDLVRSFARSQPTEIAVIDGELQLTYAELDNQMDKVATSFQEAGLKQGDAVSLCGYNSSAYVVLFLGALRAAVVPSLIAPSSTAEGIANMAKDSRAKMLFIEDTLAEAVTPFLESSMPIHSLENAAVTAWAAKASSGPTPIEIQPDWPFNIIYSSGTTGTPKGIVQSHGMRSEHIKRAGIAFAYEASSVTMIATPLYSNTTLVSFVPGIAQGGTVVIMGKFNASGFLALAAEHKATHSMLVPVQYKRIMALPDFDSYDLSSFVMKFCTSAPFSGELKGDIVARWPGGLVEFYGMTEGGGTCMLPAHLCPDKLHTVGLPAEGHDIRLIDDDGIEVSQGKIGEVVGSSSAMMAGYYGQPEKTREAEWYSPEGKRFIRTGDNGRFDEDGFLTLMDRKKDMIISGGFNIFPSDLEAELIKHEAVADVAVIGVPSEDWGETPVAIIVREKGAEDAGDTIKAWLAERVGKTQRLHDVVFTDELPRSAIGKVLKRELRDTYATTQTGG